MKRPPVHRVIPALLMTAAAAVPVGTAVEVLSRAANAETSRTIATAPTTVPSATATPALKSASRAPARRSPTPTAVPTTHVYSGAVVNDQFGAVQATITVTGRKVTSVSISAPENDPHSASVNSQAIPILQSETLQAQRPNIDIVSGATVTSDAYIQSLQAALKSAGLQ